MKTWFVGTTFGFTNKKGKVVSISCRSHWVYCISRW